MPRGARPRTINARIYAAGFPSRGHANKRARRAAAHTQVNRFTLKSRPVARTVRRDAQRRSVRHSDAQRRGHTRAFLCVGVVFFPPTCGVFFLHPPYETTWIGAEANERETFETVSRTRYD